MHTYIYIYLYLYTDAWLLLRRWRPPRRSRNRQLSRSRCRTSRSRSRTRRSRPNPRPKALTRRHACAHKILQSTPKGRNMAVLQPQTKERKTTRKDHPTSMFNIFGVWCTESMGCSKGPSGWYEVGVGLV